MAFIDLHEGILEEFAERAANADSTHAEFLDSHSMHTMTPDHLIEGRAEYKAEWKKMRAAAGRTGHVCKVCGAPIQMQLVAGKKPTTCSVECKKAHLRAAAKAWREANKVTATLGAA